MSFKTPEVVGLAILVMYKYKIFLIVLCNTHFPLHLRDSDEVISNVGIQLTICLHCLSILLQSMYQKNKTNEK